MIEKAVKDFIKRHLPQSSRIIVGLSGGADSMALLLSLHQAGCKVVATHCNFHLRGDESNRDQLHCRELCDKLNIELLVKEFDVEARRKATSESLEMACRSLRYDWWEELISTGMADYVAVGHHREDNVETLFINLFRGSGINGLKGMLPVNGHVIRPLLKCSRADIESYLLSKGYRWVTDSTNNENDFKRNRLRNIILPLLEQEFPGAMDGMVKSMDILRDNYRLYQGLIENEWSKYTHDENSVNIREIITSSPYPHVLLHEILPPLGLAHSQIDDIYECETSLNVKSSSGQTFPTPKGKYILERGLLHRVNEDIGNEEADVDLMSHPFSITYLSASEFKDEISRKANDKHSVYFDSSILDGDPVWKVRPWMKGDRFAPFGMKGTKLVSDMFNDAKYTLNQKQSARLLMRNDVPVWLIGLRASRHYCVSDTTEKVIKLSIDSLWKFS